MARLIGGAPPPRPEGPPQACAERAGDRGILRDEVVVVAIAGAVDRRPDVWPQQRAQGAREIPYLVVPRRDPARSREVRLGERRLIVPIQCLREPEEQLGIVGMQRERGAPQALRSIEVPAPGDHPRASRQRVGPIGRPRQHGIEQRQGLLRPP